MRRPLPFLILVVCGIVLDQVSKALVFSQIPLNQTRPIIQDVLHFTTSHNKGVAFSLGDQYPLLIKLFTVVASIALAIWYAVTWRTAPKLLLAALGFLLAG